MILAPLSFYEKAMINVLITWVIINLHFPLTNKVKSVKMLLVNFQLKCGGVASVRKGRMWQVNIVA